MAEVRVLDGSVRPRRASHGGGVVERGPTRRQDPDRPAVGDNVSCSTRGCATALARPHQDRPGPVGLPSRTGAHLLSTPVDRSRRAARATGGEVDDRNGIALVGDGLPHRSVHCGETWFRRDSCRLTRASSAERSAPFHVAGQPQRTPVFLPAPPVQVLQEPQAAVGDESGLSIACADRDPSVGSARGGGRNQLRRDGATVRVEGRARSALHPGSSDPGQGSDVDDGVASQGEEVVVYTHLLDAEHSAQIGRCTARCLCAALRNETRPRRPGTAPARRAVGLSGGLTRQVPHVTKADGSIRAARAGGTRAVPPWLLDSPSATT